MQSDGAFIFSILIKGSKINSGKTAGNAPVIRSDLAGHALQVVVYNLRLVIYYGFALTVLYLEMQFYQAISDFVWLLPNVQVEVICKNSIGEHNVRIGQTCERFELAASPYVGPFRATAVVA